MRCHSLVRVAASPMLRSEPLGLTRNTTLFKEDWSGHSKQASTPFNRPQRPHRKSLGEAAKSLGCQRSKPMPLVLERALTAMRSWSSVIGGSGGELLARSLRRETAARASPCPETRFQTADQSQRRDSRTSKAPKQCLPSLTRKSGETGCPRRFAQRWRTPGEECSIA